jgi:hypothetical protein
MSNPPRRSETIINAKTILLLAVGLIPMMGTLPLCWKIWRICPPCDREHHLFFTLLAACTMAVVAALSTAIARALMSFAERRWRRRRRAE